MEAEIRKIIEQKHLTKLVKCSERVFISPVVVTIKKDNSVKFALYCKILTKSLNKNKYQMPNVETLIDQVGHTISRLTAKNYDILLSKIDLRYLYSQLRKTSQQQNIVTLLFCAVPPNEPINFKTVFMDSRICPRISKISNHLKRKKTYANL